jgi:hypothetical protein
MRLAARDTFSITTQAGLQMATASAISPVPRKLAMNPVLPFDARNSNTFLITDENKAVSALTSRNEQYRVLFSNTNRSTYGPLIPPAKTNAPDSVSVNSCYNIPQHVESMPTVNKRDVRPGPPEKPRSNLSALLEAQSESRTPKPISAIHVGCSPASTENRSRDKTGFSVIDPSPVEMALAGFSSSVMDNNRLRTRTTRTPPRIIPAVAPPGSGRENNAEKQSIPNKGEFIRISKSRRYGMVILFCIVACM